MKVAVLSDVHGNLPALEAVIDDIDQWRPDLVVVNGDTVNRGPYSLTCWERIAAEGWIHLTGNHEGYVWGRTQGHAYDDPITEEMTYLSKWTAEQMGETAVSLPPDNFCYPLENGRICHAATQSNTDGIYEDAFIEKTRQQIAPAPSLFVTAHTHRPFIQTVDQTLIVNVGSVGQVCDQGLDASYGRLQLRANEWQATIRRVPYDRAQTNQDFADSGFLDEVGSLAWLIYHEWRLGTELMIPWRQQYLPAVYAQQCSLTESVQQYMVDHNLPFRLCSVE